MWFMDYVDVVIGSSRQALQSIDPLFLQAIEPETLKVGSVSCSHPVPIGAVIREGVLQVTAGPCVVANTATIQLMGIRKGCADMRFAPRSEEQMRNNNERWRHLSGV